MCGLTICVHTNMCDVCDVKRRLSHVWQLEWIGVPTVRADRIFESHLFTAMPWQHTIRITMSGRSVDVNETTNDGLCVCLLYACGIVIQCFFFQFGFNFNWVIWIQQLFFFLFLLILMKILFRRVFCTVYLWLFEVLWSFGNFIYNGIMLKEFSWFHILVFRYSSA